MALFNRIGNILKQAGSKHINSELSASNSSLYQAIRCMSSSKLFIGGLSYGTDEESLRGAFGQYGEVVEARIIMDRGTGRSRGFGFVSYTSSEGAANARQAMDGQDLQGRRLRVDFATEKPRGGGFGGSYGGGGGYGSYGAGGGGFGSYGSGGGNYGGDGSYSGGNFGSGGGNYGSGGGSYDSGSYRGGGAGFGDGNSGGYDGSANYGVAGGASGGDSGFQSGGFGGSAGATPAYGGNQVRSGGNESFGHNESLGEGNYRDDDEPDDYANTRG